MNYILIGDVHGCFYTYKSMISKYWNPQDEILIQVGDLVHKGKNTYDVLAYSFHLSQAYPKNYIQLRGNNDEAFINQLIKKGISKELQNSLSMYGLNSNELIHWIENLPYYYEKSNFFVSHAGIDKKNTYPKISNLESLITTREKLKNIGKTQYVGHVIVEMPTYNKNADAWYIDTGAGIGDKLSAVKLKKNGKVAEIICIPIKSKDITI